MRLKSTIILTIVALLAFSSIAVATEAEEELQRKFLQRIEKEHVQKLTWMSGYFSFNRINRDNDYNKFSYKESQNFSNAEVPWLGDGKAFGLEMGVIFKEKYAWSVSGEYNMKMGDEIEGSHFYNPTGTTIDNPKSEISLYGFNTGLQYYIYNAPTLANKLTSLALRTGISVGYYKVKWDLWSDYYNLNLSTATTELSANNTSFEDTAPSISVHFGADYPVNFMGFDLGIDLSYLYLNFDQVSWYNSQDEEIIASYTSTSTDEGRVDLNFSGIKGKIEIKRFFNW